MPKNTEESEEEMDRLQAICTADLKKRFKIYCAGEGTNMTDVILSLVESHLEENGA